MKKSCHPNGCGSRISATGRFCAASCITLGLSLGLAPLATGQAGSSGQTTKSEPYQAVVTGTDLNIRCGPGQSYYPVGKFHTGTIVTVIGDDFGWARIQTTGKAFDNMFAWVGQDQLRLEANGRTGTALGRVYLLAPNATYNESPKSSWKPFAELQVEEQIEVLDQLEADGERYYKVRVPTTGQVWVSAEFLRRATQAEVQAWTTASTQAPQAPQATAEDPPTLDPASPSGEEPATIDAPTTDLVDQGDPLPTTPPAANSDPSTDSTTAEPPAIEPTTTAGADTTTQPPTDVEAGIVMPDIQNREAVKTLANVTFDDLESSYEVLKRQPIREAEINGLRQRYMAVLESPDTYNRRHLVIAEGRVKLLKARADLQEQMFNLDRLRNKTTLSDEAAEAVRLSLQAATQYVAVGRIAASTIYDGKRLPRLLRLADPESGRTIAYIRTDADTPYDTTGMIGRMVGIVGDKNFDQSLRLNIIAPTRVDVISSSRGG